MATNLVDGIGDRDIHSSNADSKRLDRVGPSRASHRFPIASILSRSAADGRSGGSFADDFPYCACCSGSCAAYFAFGGSQSNCSFSRFDCPTIAFER